MHAGTYMYIIAGLVTEDQTLIIVKLQKFRFKYKFKTSNLM